MPPKKTTTTPRPTVKRNTTGLEKFAKARDIVLKKKGGFPNFKAFTAAIRAIYDAQKLGGFDGWRKARDTALKRAGFKNGYATLMSDAKAEFAKMK